MPRIADHRRLWRSVRGLPEFQRLLEFRVVSQFGDGLFQAALAGALLFNPERETGPWEIALAFAVLYLPYSVLGPFAGALLDRWDRRWVLVGANLGRLTVVLLVAGLLASGADDLPILIGALLVNGCSRFVSSGLSAALPDVVPRDQVLVMNSVATAGGAVAAFLGALVMLLLRWPFGADDAGAATIVLFVTAPVLVALVLALRFAPQVLGPHDSVRGIHGSVVYAVATGWVHGARTVRAVPTVAATLSGLTAHRIAFGINTLLVLVIVRQSDTPAVAGLGATMVFFTASGTGVFLANLVTPAAVGRFGRFGTANGALALAATIQLCGVGLQLPMLVLCGFLLGAAGQVVKLCTDSAMQIDVDDALRGHVFTVQDSLIWVSFTGAIAAAAAVMPDDGHAPALVLVGSVVYLAGLAAHARLGRDRHRLG